MNDYLHYIGDDIIDILINLLGLSPMLTIIGFIVYVLFFSNFFNLLDANYFEKELMDSRHRFSHVLSKFVMITLIIIISMALIGYRLAFIPYWVFNGISIVLLLLFIFVSGLKTVWDISGKMPTAIEYIIDKKKNILVFATVLLLFASVAVVGGYVFKMSKELPINSGIDSSVFIIIGIIIFSLLLSGWLFSIIGLLNYKKKTIHIEMDNRQYVVEKVIFNGKIQLKALTYDKRMIVSVDELEKHEMTIM